ncbi:MAG: hypothetical protein RIA65_05205 [Woeseia sp.]
MTGFIRRRIAVERIAPGLLVLLAACTVMAAAPAGAQEYRHFPGLVPDLRTARVQERVETLYNQRDYQLALRNYEEFLAPLGDKYAQYMVGYMHLSGQGTTPDPVRALAWYRLAAERNERPYVEARDALAAMLDDEQLATADRDFVKLRRRLGDRQLLVSLIRRDVNALRRFDSEPLQDHASAGFMGGAPIDYRALTLDRLRQRAEYLERLPPEKDADASEDDIRAVVARYLN